MQLGFGATGAPATLSNAPPIGSLEDADEVLISRNGILFSVSWPTFLAMINPGTFSQISAEATRAEAAEGQLSAELTATQGSLSSLFATVTSQGVNIAANEAAISALPATGAEIAAALQTAPAEHLAAFNNIYLSGALPASNTGAGGGLFADGTFLSFGYAPGI